MYIRASFGKGRENLAPAGTANQITAAPPPAASPAEHQTEQATTGPTGHAAPTQHAQQDTEYRQVSSTSDYSEEGDNNSDNSDNMKDECLNEVYMCIGIDNSNSYTNLLIRALLAVLFYLLLSMACFMPLEGWSALDTIYFAVITFTTVGFGDVVPKTANGKVCAIFLIYLGIFTCGSLLHEFFSKILSHQENIYNDEIQKMKQRALPGESHIRLLHEKLQEHGRNELKHGIALIIGCFGLIYGFGILYCTLVGYTSVLDAIYFTTVILFTIGYGDVSASSLHHSEVTKIVLCFFIILAVFSFAAMVSVAIKLRNGVLRRRNLKHMIERKYTEADFNRFVQNYDIMGENSIDGIEFAFICLDEMRLLPEEADAATLMAIQQHFREYDTGGSGKISLNNIVHRDENQRPKKIAREVTRTMLERTRSYRSVNNLRSPRAIRLRSGDGSKSPKSPRYAEAKGTTTNTTQQTPQSRVRERLRGKEIDLKHDLASVASGDDENQQNPVFTPMG
eukprot:CAMPEP_0197517664 /NCGR_PEP_ID=MMETSP1318-20131121/2707_1 /TAXON_ID=552666 /ORGANISM="Partenskyella glossopodia, Strain RCC365" /LENGTH=507 /DNA_ID=CAMNT_0043067409 /DNA_START=387 /DNA_END=1910 /DNA_ORIENTATION=+